MDFKAFFNIDKVYEYTDLKKIDSKVAKQIDAFITDIESLFGVYTVLVPIARDGMYWTDYAESFLQTYKKIPYEDIEKAAILHIRVKNDKLVKHPFGLSYPAMKKSDKLKMIQILDKHFPKKYKWNGSNNMQILLNSSEYKKIDTGSLKEDDSVPILYLNIEATGNYSKIIRKIEKITGKTFTDYSYPAWDASPLDTVSCTITEFDPDSFLPKLLKILGELEAQPNVLSWEIDLKTDSDTPNRTIKSKKRNPKSKILSNRKPLSKPSKKKSSTKNKPKKPNRKPSKKK